ncbi:hypothetical protein TIFTF001_023380 [Ficus carica]|uniref:Uncharacterized protein n=1 Tax=Ficus carica TaxID=3494 RepID=A0AA88AEL1_FICCA|nr:hypothetical protein TIFTF001_023380 [Ficus carica]
MAIVHPAGIHPEWVGNGGTKFGDGDRDEDKILCSKFSRAGMKNALLTSPPRKAFPDLVLPKLIAIPRGAISFIVLAFSSFAASAFAMAELEGKTGFEFRVQYEDLLPIGLCESSSTNSQKYSPS